jgi:hypothetical protein
LFLTVSSLAFLVFAAEYEFVKEDDKLKEILTGMTFDGYHHKKDYEIRRYYAADGTMYGRNPNRGDVHGSWWINDGQLCFKWSHGNKVKCRYVGYSSGQVMIYKHRRKKGTYELRITLINRRPGNPLKFSQ